MHWVLEQWNGMDERGQGLIKTGVSLVVGLLIIGLLASVLLPEAINNTVEPHNNSAGFPPASWGSIETTLWELLPMAYVLGVILFVIALALDQF